MFTNKQMQANARSSTAPNIVQSPSRQKNATKQRTGHNVLQRAALNPGSLLAGDILQLQKTIGNQAVIQLLSAYNQKPASNDAGQLSAAEELYLNSVLAGNINTSRDISANTTPTLQARFWDSDMTQPLSRSQLIEKIAKLYPQYSNKLEALNGMEHEEVDYILPANEEQYKSTLETWIDAYEHQDLINVTKMLNIINSILKNGILNQEDRQKILNITNKAKTSTDDVKGSQNVHGIRIEQGSTQENLKRAQYAQQQSVNVLAEVKDDLVISGTKKRIIAGLLSQDEREYIIVKLMNIIDSMIDLGLTNYQELKQALLENRKNAGFVKVKIGSGNIMESTLDYAMNKVADSERGRNEINKRMMTGFLSIVDSEKIPEEIWDMKPGPLGEGVVKASIPPTLILKMILPKYLLKYADQIENPYKIPIVYQYIEYPAEGEIHLYSPNTGTTVLRNEINLMWHQQVSEELKTHKEILTHMTRGF